MFNHHILCQLGTELAERERWLEAFDLTTLKYVRPEGFTFQVNKVMKLIKYEPLCPWQSELDRAEEIAAIWEYAYQVYGRQF